jgi:hypothetical protein
MSGRLILHWLALDAPSEPVGQVQNHSSRSAEILCFQ